MPFLSVNGRRLEIERIAGHAPDAPTLVFLHEGLGSIALWRDFPARLAAATGCAALIYSRYGYGRSQVLLAPREVGYMHEEALETLPALLAGVEIAAPVPIGRR